MSDLKACPFCGENNISIIVSLGKHHGICNECFAITGKNTTLSGAVDHWNTRTPQDNWISVSKLNDSHVGKKVIFDQHNDIYSGSIGCDEGELPYFMDNDFEIHNGVTMFKVVSLPTIKGG